MGARLLATTAKGCFRGDVDSPLRGSGSGGLNTGETLAAGSLFSTTARLECFIRKRRSRVGKSQRVPESRAWWYLVLMQVDGGICQGQSRSGLVLMLQDRAGDLGLLASWSRTSLADLH